MTGSTDPRRGEIWLVALGAGRHGEPAKNRPAVIVSADELQTGDARDLIVVVPLSSTRAASALRPEVGTGTGIDRASRAICAGVRAVVRTRLLRRVGRVGPVTMAEIERSLAQILRLR